MCRVAIHQLNFCPWFPFFYKMAMVDKFYLFKEAQFQKNGYQNRFQYKGKWITKPVHNKKEMLWHKDYVGSDTDWHNIHQAIRGGSVYRLNRQWIDTLRSTLDIYTELHTHRRASMNKGYAEMTFGRFGTPTQTIIEIVKELGGTTYVTNEDAKDKYLDEDAIREVGIELEYCKVPKQLQRSTFEIIEEYGIEGAIKQLPRELCKV